MREHLCMRDLLAERTVHHALPVMLAIFAVQVYERRAWRYRPELTAAAIGLVGIVAIAMGAAS